MKEKFVSFDLELSTLTPIHIGSGINLRKGSDFFTDNQKLGKADLNKIIQFIPNIEHLTNLISEGKDIYAELKNKGINLQDVSTEILPVKALQGKELAEFIRNRLTQEPIIPGSSIKGAIRTALLAKPLKEYYKNKIDEIIRNFKKYRTRDLELLKPLIEIRPKPRYNPQNDIFKYIQITDAQGKIENLLVDTYKTLNMDRYEKWYVKERLTQNKEVFEGEVKFRIKINNRFFTENKLGIKNIQEFLERINNHTHHLLQNEIENFEVDIEEGFFNDDKLGTQILENLQNINLQAQNSGILLRMGSGSGWEFMTGAWLKEISEDKWDNIKKLLVKKTWYAEFPYPKTRRLTSTLDFPGFVGLKIIKE